MILLIDNYDSFTYNLYQYLAQMDEVMVYRNDKIKLDDIEELKPKHIVISPGPGRPEDSGISRDIIKKFGDIIPILGVCLGHQCIASVFGGNVIKAEKPLHGKVSQIIFKDDKILEGISSPLSATRYHSLIVDSKNVPEQLEIIAETEMGEIMALKHKEKLIYGLQFHPESIFTKDGMIMLKNFVNMSYI
ncbi:MAG: anthranilate synthase component II [Bacillota bacterium]